MARIARMAAVSSLGVGVARFLGSGWGVGLVMISQWLEGNVRVLVDVFIRWRRRRTVTSTRARIDHWLRARRLGDHRFAVSLSAPHGVRVPLAPSDPARELRCLLHVGVGVLRIARGLGCSLVPENETLERGFAGPHDSLFTKDRPIEFGRARLDGLLLLRELSRRVLA